jgi:hypothetical protein
VTLNILGYTSTADSGSAKDAIQLEIFRRMTQEQSISFPSRVVNLRGDPPLAAPKPP